MTIILTHIIYMMYMIYYLYDLYDLCDLDRHLSEALMHYSKLRADVCGVRRLCT